MPPKKAPTRGAFFNGRRILRVMGKIARRTARTVYKNGIKPQLFKRHPDDVHHQMVSSTRRFGRLAAPLRILAHTDKRLEQNLFGLHFANPIGISAGLDKNAEMAHVARAIGCGFTTVGSLTDRPRQGNEHPWFYRLPKTRSLAVHVGMANLGLDIIAPRLKRRPGRFPLVASVAVVSQRPGCNQAEIITDACAAALRLKDSALCDAVEINISCPNVADDQPFTHAPALHKLLTAIDKLALGKPVFVKMPNLTSWPRYQEMLDVILKHNVQAVVVANLVKDRANISVKDDLPANVRGGLSGEPCRERSLALIRQTYNYCGDKLTIIGVGGTFTAQDAYDKIRAGASLVGMITGLIFEGPQVVGEINAGLSELLARDGLTNIQEAVGKNSY